MLTKLVCKFGYKVITNPAILAEAAPSLIPAVVIAAAYDTIEHLRK